MSLLAERLVLRPSTDGDRADFAALHADPAVMRDLGGPISRAESNRKLEGYIEARRRHGYCRWRVEDRAGSFLGYVGIMPRRESHPLGAHDEIGWRLRREAWGSGYATEAARAAIRDGLTRLGLPRILAYTAPDNAESQAVISRLRLRRDASLDFILTHGRDRGWRGLVWVAEPPA